MKKLLIISLISCFAACTNGNSKVNPDSSNIITDSAALKNADSTGILGANRIRERQAGTDTPNRSSDVGK